MAICQLLSTRLLSLNYFKKYFLIYNYLEYDICNKRPVKTFCILYRKLVIYWYILLQRLPSNNLLFYCYYVDCENLIDLYIYHCNCKLNETRDELRKVKQRPPGLRDELWILALQFQKRTRSVQYIFIWLHIRSRAIKKAHKIAVKILLPVNRKKQNNCYFHNTYNVYWCQYWLQFLLSYISFINNF